jgi:hypothetical protein
MFDSVFSPIVQFAEEAPYPEDEPILDRKEILDSFKQREDRYTGLLQTVGFSSTDAWWKEIEPHLESGDRLSTQKNPWTLHPNYQGLLYGLWTDVWDVGANHAVKALNIVNHQVGLEPANFALPEYPQEPFYTAYPPNYGYPLRNTDLRNAVEARTLFLADDVNKKTSGSIERVIEEAASLHGAGGIPRGDRSKLLQKINLILGRQSLAEIRDPSISVGEKLIRTKLAIPGTTSFSSRSKTIAATELSAGYSLGRLQVYKQAKLKMVRWQTLEDMSVCRLCRSRNGIVLSVDVLFAQHRVAFKQRADPTQMVIPCHPVCRCLWVPVDGRRQADDRRLADPGRSQQNRDVAPTKGSWNTLKNAISLTLSLASVAGSAVAVDKVKEVEQERVRQEQSQKLARNIIVAGGAALSLGLLYMLMQKVPAQQTTTSSVTQPGVSPLVAQGEAIGSLVAQTGVDVVEQLTDQTDTAGTQAALKNALTKQEQINAVKNLPVLPYQILTEPDQQATLAKLPPGLDLKTIQGEVLINLYGLTYAEARLVKELKDQYEKDRITPPTTALIPQFFIDKGTLALYPGLKRVRDLRSLNPRSLLMIVGGSSRIDKPNINNTINKKFIRKARSVRTVKEYVEYQQKLKDATASLFAELNGTSGKNDNSRYKAINILLSQQRNFAYLLDRLSAKLALEPENFLEQILAQQQQLAPQITALFNNIKQLISSPVQQAGGLGGFIEKQIQNQLGLPPARFDGPPGRLEVAGVNLNTATIEEIARLFPAGITIKERNEWATKIYNILRERYRLGEEIKSIDELREAVGEKIIKKLLTSTYTKNLNLLYMVEKSGPQLTEIVASMLSIAPKLSNAIGYAFYRAGQFGEDGSDPIEDLIERVQRIVDARLFGTIVFDEKTRNRIRTILAGHLVVVQSPATQPVVEPQPVKQVEVQAQGVGGSGGVRADTPRSSSVVVRADTPPGVRADIPPGVRADIPPGVRANTPPGVRADIPPGVRAEAEESKDLWNDLLTQYDDVQLRYRNLQGDISSAVDKGRTRDPNKIGGQGFIATLRSQFFGQADKWGQEAGRKTSGAVGNATQFESQMLLLQGEVNELRQLLEDETDPASPSIFSPRGNRGLISSVKEKVKQNNRKVTSILAQIKEIEDFKKEGFGSLLTRLLKLKKNLEDLRKKSLTIAKDIGKAERERLLLRIDNEAAKISALSQLDLGQNYLAARKIRSQYEVLKINLGNPDSFDIVTPINSRLVLVDESIASLTGDFAGVAKYKVRFLEVKDFLKNFPQTLNQFIGSFPEKDHGTAASVSSSRNTVQAKQAQVLKAFDNLFNELEKQEKIILKSRAEYESVIALTGLDDSKAAVQAVITEQEKELTSNLEVIKDVGKDRFTRNVPLKDARNARVLPGVGGEDFVIGQKTSIRERVKIKEAQLRKPYTKVNWAVGEIRRAINTNVYASRLEQSDAVANLRKKTLVTSNFVKSTISANVDDITESLQDLKEFSIVNYLTFVTDGIRGESVRKVGERYKERASYINEEYDERSRVLKKIQLKLEAEIQVDPTYQFGDELLTIAEIESRISTAEAEARAIAASRRSNDLTPIRQKFEGVSIRVAEIEAQYGIGGSLSSLMRARLDSVGISDARVMEIFTGASKPTAAEQAMLNTFSPQNLEEFRRYARVIVAKAAQDVARGKAVMGNIQSSQPFLNAAKTRQMIDDLPPAERATLDDAATRGALESFNQWRNLKIKEADLTQKKDQAWAEITNKLTDFNKNLRKTLGKEISVNPNIRQQNGMSFTVNDSTASDAFNWSDVFENPFASNTVPISLARGKGKEERRQMLRIKSRGEAQISQIADMFEALPWVGELLGFGGVRETDIGGRIMGLAGEGKAQLNRKVFEKYINEVEEGMKLTWEPTTYVDMEIALSLIRLRHKEKSAEMSFVGFKSKGKSMVHFRQLDTPPFSKRGSVKHHARKWS